jgi:hypothetical protein
VNTAAIDISGLLKRRASFKQRKRPDPSPEMSMRDWRDQAPEIVEIEGSIVGACVVDSGRGPVINLIILDGDGNLHKTEPRWVKVLP